VDFSDVSYGFRPYRCCHDALDMVDMIIMNKPVNSVVDMDITKFFDMVDLYTSIMRWTSGLRKR
jgi:RNA-directed DNA polymerase